MSETFKFVVDESFGGTRLDSFLASTEPRISRTSFKKLIKNGNVSLDGVLCSDPGRKVAVATRVAVEFSFSDSGNAVPSPEKLPLEIIFEDEYLLVLNKKAGMVVHPGDGTPSGTVVNALLWYFKDSDSFRGFDDSIRPGIAHRLDKDTSGCLVVAKTPDALNALQNSFKKRLVDKTYLAVVLGTMTGKGELTNYIARHPVNRKKMAVSDDAGKKAVSRYETLAVGDAGGVPVSLLKFDIETGRTHQIRVQTSAVGHPVAGDALYGGARKIDAERQMLHAWHITFPHPETSEKMTFEASLPQDIRSFIDKRFPLGVFQAT
ncbi:MAG: RluA family pseudouridine synthase [Kiritimatiellaeota bacterium]|nr:RluA family pseudouridine synthase [Kiritimatiellota bacterium]